MPEYFLVFLTGNPFEWLIKNEDLSKKIFVLSRGGWQDFDKFVNIEKRLSHRRSITLADLIENTMGWKPELYVALLQELL